MTKQTCPADGGVMKLAGLPKFSLLLPLAGVLAALAGCGGSSNLALNQGNWAVSGTSTATARVNTSSISFVAGGNLTQSGNSISATLHITQSECFDPSETVSFSGTVKGSDVTLTANAAEEEATINVKASGSKDSLTGT